VVRVYRWKERDDPASELSVEGNTFDFRQA